jgi:site-specific recombinase XerD
MCAGVTGLSSEDAKIAQAHMSAPEVVVVRIVRTLEGGSQIPANFPVLVSREMVIIEPAFAWLLMLATIPGRSHSSDTLRTYAEHLYEWLDTLEQSGVDWREVSEGHLAAWRNRMLSGVSAHTRRPFSRSTINDRVRTVCRFYLWAHQRGWVEAAPFHFVDVRVSQARPTFLAHIKGPRGVTAANVLTVAQHERLPRSLRVAELKRFFDELRMPHHLIAQWALTSGMRRKELCGLEVRQVPNVLHLAAEENPLIGVPLTITKGDEPRTVYLPIGLIDRTQRYLAEERESLVRRMKRQDVQYRCSDRLFLNRRGRPVTRARLTRVFSDAFRAAGLSASGHWLRHTFAMMMLVRLQEQARRSPDMNPLKIVQVLLGHRSIHSTSIYLRCVELHQRELSESIAWLYGTGCHEWRA